MTTPHIRRLLPVAALAGAALLTLGLSACVPESAAPSPSGSSASARPSSSASGSASTAPTASPSGDTAACLVGTWTMGQTDLEGFYNDVNGALAGAGVSFAPQGSATLALGADGAFTWTPAVQLDAAVSGTTIVVTIGGDITGTYSATSDRITTANQSTDNLQVSATIDGAETDAGSVTQEIAGAPVTDASYTCAGDTLTLVSQIGGSPATSVLHRG